jgi:phage FluMu protein gp41
LENHHPVYGRKQTIEHIGTVGVQAGVMSKDEIAALSDEDLQRLIAVRKIEQDEVRAEIARLEAEESVGEIVDNDGSQSRG